MESRTTKEEDKTLVGFDNLNADGTVFVSCDARGEKNDFLTVGYDGTVMLGGQPLSETTEAETLRWVGAALGRMLVTGRRSPVPG